MPTDLFKQVLFNNGEGLVHTDLNNVAKFADARLNDMIFSRMVGNLATDEDPSITGEHSENPALTSLIYTLTGGCAVIKQGSTTTRVTITSGTIFQKIANVDGADAKFLSYMVDESDVDLVIAAGDATNPRIDILQCKLEYVDGGLESRDVEDATTEVVTTQSINKTRRVQATFSIKAGTPAATPTYPTPDAGYALLAAVRVPASWAANFSADTLGSSAAILRQCSIPLEVEAVTVFPKDFDLNSGPGANWSIDTNGQAVAGADATDLIVWVPGASPSRRIVGVDIVAIWATSGTVHLTSMTWNSVTFWGQAGIVCDLSSQLVTTGGTTQSKFAHLGDIADASDVSNPTAAAGPIGDPIWAGGGCSGPGLRKIERNSGNLSGSSWASHACLMIDAGSGSKIVAVTFYLAG